MLQCGCWVELRVLTGEVHLLAHAIRYRIVRAVSDLQTEDTSRGVPVASIAAYIGRRVNSGLYELLRRMSQQTHRDPAYIWRGRSGYRLTIDGDLLLEEAYCDPSLRRDTGKWSDRVRWPSEERISVLENVAVPDFDRAGCTDPEAAAFRTSFRLLAHAEDIDEKEMARNWQRMLKN